MRFVGLYAGIFVVVFPGLVGAASFEINSAKGKAHFTTLHVVSRDDRSELVRQSGDVVVRGTIKFDKKNPGASVVDATVDTKAVNTHSDNSEVQGRIASLLESDKHPSIHFKSKKVQSSGKGQYKVSGALTMRGVTRDVVADVTTLEQDMADAKADPKLVGVSLSTRINPKDFNLDPGKALANGGARIGNAVAITLDLELVQSKGPAAPESGTEK